MLKPIFLPFECMLINKVNVKKNFKIGKTKKYIEDFFYHICFFELMQSNDKYFNININTL